MGLLAATALALGLAGCTTGPASSRSSHGSSDAGSAPRKLQPRPARQTNHQTSASLDAPPTLQPGARLEDYVALALVLHPRLGSAVQSSLSARAAVGTVGRFPDPRLRYRSFLQEVETRVGPQDQAIGLSWTLPWFGKRALQREAAERSAEARDHRTELVRARVVGDVKRAYFEALHLERALNVIRRRRTLAAETETIARARYRSGAGGSAQPDVIRAQLELERLNNEMRSLEDRRVSLEARLRAAIGLRAEAPLPWPSQMPELETLPSAKTFLDAVERSNPSLREREAMWRKASHDVELARKAPWPDVTLGVDYIDTGSARMAGVPDSGDDALSLSISFPLPLDRGRYASLLRAARSRLRADELALDAERDDLRSLASEVYFRAQDARRRFELYESTLLPKARESRAATKASYRGGDGSFQDLIDVERLLLEFELARERALADFAVEWATMEELFAGQGMTPSEPAQGDGERAG